jgi:ribosomal protein L4
MKNLEQMTDEQVMTLYYDLVSKGNLEMSNNNINKAQVHFAELLKVNDEVKARNLTVEEWI